MIRCSKTRKGSGLANQNAAQLWRTRRILPGAQYMSTAAREAPHPIGKLPQEDTATTAKSAVTIIRTATQSHNLLRRRLRAHLMHTGRVLLSDIRNGNHSTSPSNEKISMRRCRRELCNRGDWKLNCGTHSTSLTVPPLSCTLKAKMATIYDQPVRYIDNFLSNIQCSHQWSMTQFNVHVMFGCRVIHTLKHKAE